ncbi:MAG: desmoglein-4 [Eubacteriales bacterium]|nr:desmoglein-4 [Eubacteriales bacterium]
MKKFKQSFAILATISTVIATPLTAMAAHTHSWGPDMYYGSEIEKPALWEDTCATRHIYNYHTCLTCGFSEIWESNSYVLQHSFVNNSCIYCGLTYLREATK